MKLTQSLLSTIIIALMLVSYSACKNQPEQKAGDTARQKKEAIAVSDGWITLIDNEKYVESWTGAADIFKKSITAEQWTRALTVTRKPLGKIINRTLDSKEYRTSLPGAPDGEYVVITYRTSFENKKDAVETITPMKDVDGSWRVSGYYI